MKHIFEAVNAIVDEYTDVKVIYPLHKNPKVREIAYKYFKDNDRVRLIEPLDVYHFHNYIQQCFLIMTDSGGVQEEAPSLGKPVLVLRENTERTEGVATSTQLRVVLGVSKALVSRSVTSLEQKGLITVKGIPNDKRISHIELTEDAIPVLEKINIEIEKINQVLFKDIPTKDIQCMIETMNKMNEKIEGAN